MTSVPSPAPSPPLNHRRVVAAALIGSMIEYYEFGVYGLMASVIAPQFFPQVDPAAALLATFLLFAVAFVIRPLGGIVLGRIGDARGRKNVLMLTIIGTGVATAAIGLLPTYASVGLLAPALLLVARLVQGFFTGGEGIGASAYVAESVPRDRRGFFGAFTPTGVALGLGLAAMVAGIMFSVTTDAEMAAWGWRIPFLCAVPLILIGILLRRRLTESDEFSELIEEGSTAQAPVREVLRNHKASLLKVLLVGYAQNVGYWVGITFMNTYLISYQHYESSNVLWLTMATTIGMGITMPFWGWLSDKVGRRKVLAVGLLSYAVLALPMMNLMGGGNFALACVGFVVLALPFPIVQAVGYPTYTEQFPTRVRYTGLAISYNLATILGGGLSPYLATLLITVTGWNLAPALLLLVSCVIGLVALRWVTDVSARGPKGTALAGDAAPIQTVPSGQVV